MAIILTSSKPKINIGVTVSNFCYKHIDSFQFKGSHSTPLNVFPTFMLMKLLTILSMGRDYTHSLASKKCTYVLAHHMLLFSTRSLHLHFDVHFYNRFPLLSKLLSCLLGFMSVLVSAYCCTVCDF